MKKILIISNHSFMLWQFRRELISALQQNNEIVICVPFGDHIEDFKELGCRVIDTPLKRRSINPFSDLKLYNTYKKILNEEKPDKVITYSVKPNVYAGYLCRRLGIPYYVNVQGLGTAFQTPILSSVITVMYRIALKNAAKVFFENDINAELFRTLNITSAEQQLVLRGAGVNLNYYPHTPYPENNTTRFLYLGRIMKEKGIDELFTAAKALKSEGVDFRLDMVGFFDGKYKKIMQELQSQGIIKFHGFRQDPRPFYTKADCVVLPSYHEGMSNVLLEAAATGRPIITCDIPGCKEAVNEGVSGLLCEVKNADSLYDTMKQFLSLSREERQAMGNAGRSHMESVFDKIMIVNKTLEALGE